MSCGERPPDNVVAREHHAPRGRFRHRTRQRDADGTLLDTWYPAPALGSDAPDTRATLEPLTGSDHDRETRTTVVRTEIGSLADPPVDASDVYLRLHLLSHRLVAPHEINLDGIFGLLANVVWTNHGPCAVPGSS